MITDIYTKDQIITGVAKYFDITNDELLHGSQTREESKPRHIAMYYLRTNTNIIHEDILRMFGKRQRGTVIYAVRSVKGQADVYPEYARMLAEIKDSILGIKPGYDDIFMGNDFLTN